MAENKDKGGEEAYELDIPDKYKKYIIKTRGDLTNILKMCIQDGGPPSFGAYFILRNRYILSDKVSAPAWVEYNLLNPAIRFSFNPERLNAILSNRPANFLKIFAFICCHEVFHLIKDHLTFDIFTLEEWKHQIEYESKKNDSDEDKYKYKWLKKKINEKLQVHNIICDMQINCIVNGLFSDDVDNFFLPSLMFPYSLDVTSSSLPHTAFYPQVYKHHFKSNGKPIEKTKDEIEEERKYKAQLAQIIEGFLKSLQKKIDKTTEPKKKIQKIFSECIAIISSLYNQCTYTHQYGTLKNFLVFAKYRVERGRQTMKEARPSQITCEQIVKNIMNMDNHRSPVAILNKLKENIVQSLFSEYVADLVISLTGWGDAPQGKGDQLNKNVNDILDDIKKNIDNIKESVKDKIKETYGEWKKSIGSEAIRGIEDYISEPPPPLPNLRWDKILQGQMEVIFSKIKGFNLPNARRSYLYKNSLRPLVPMGILDYDKAAKVAMITDVSGSMSERDISYTIALVYAITKKYGITLYLFQADTRLIDQFVIVKNRSNAINFKLIRRGYGGTDFGGPIKGVIKKVKPNVVLYLTDLWGSCGEPPIGVKVVWLCVNNDMRPSYGQLIKLKTSPSH